MGRLFARRCFNLLPDLQHLSLVQYDIPDIFSTQQPSLWSYLPDQLQSVQLIRCSGAFLHVTDLQALLISKKLVHLKRLIIRLNQGDRSFSLPLELDEQAYYHLTDDLSKLQRHLRKFGVFAGIPSTERSVYDHVIHGQSENGALYDRWMLHPQTDYTQMIRMKTQSVREILAATQVNCGDRPDDFLSLNWSYHDRNLKVS